MKQVERFDVSPIEQELRLKEWLKTKGIKQILFDGDDTLWKTVPIFRRQMRLCDEYIAREVGGSEEFWKGEIDVVNNKLFETMGVNPRRWNTVISIVGDKHGLPQEVRRGALKIVKEIYKIPPEIIEGTEKGLELVKRIGIEIGIVTHANRKWTRLKFDKWLRLERFLNWDDVYIVDEDGHKTDKSWREAMEYFRVRPENCMVVGDSPRSDIEPSYRNGVRNCVLVRDPKTPIWSVHQRELNPETRVITNIDELRWLGKELTGGKRIRLDDL